MEEYKKKYEEALERGSRLWESDSITREAYEYIFPELKEGEDEKIRKWIVDELKDSLHTIEALYSGDYDNRDKDDIIREGYLRRALAWLKNKGEQKPVDLNSVSIQKLVDIYRNTDEYDEDGNLKGKPVNCMIRAYEQGIRDILKTIKQKYVEPAWSEEDERILSKIQAHLREFYVDKKGYPYVAELDSPEMIEANWLKSLKERMKGE